MSDAPRDTRRGDELSHERAFFADMAARAQRYGLRPGFASAKYKDEFGDWPPREWSDAVVRSYNSDPGWQARAEYRKKEREHFEAWEKEVKPIALERKAAWLKKYDKSLGSVAGQEGSIVGVHQSGKRARPIHAFVVGKDLTLCGKLVTGWFTERRPFRASTEYGCKKCKKIFAERNQLTIGGAR